MKKRKSNGSKLYKSYVFRDKDPAMDVLRTLVEDSFGHRVSNADLEQIEADGGPSTGCMQGWFFGKTKRPQNATLEAAGRAIGYHRVWQAKR